MKKKIRVSRAEIGHADAKIAYFRPGLKSGSWIRERRLLRFDKLQAPHPVV